MQIQELVPQTNDIEISEITLLSINEARELSREVRETDSWWWLRSPGRHPSYIKADPYDAADVYYDGEVYTDAFNVNYNGGVRPALRISNFGSSNLNIGDKFSAGGEEWTVISKDVALCDRIVGQTYFRKDVDALDANVYEQSDIKKWLENWALVKGIHTTAQLEQMQGRA